ncbi:Ferrochelatase [Vibrio aerogenes CECT 7868]|uniref:Ferrochelatase n=1 Tax=Vibrio aerogenes CECT 7868 TaxID=1216006 RepID=A0A1M5Z0H5_9VIBR|nr:ferrochelatase [Vibrio aerogenes]SHI17558.1 Ferrochelatase [Vibrio aerogenes CECT 7868]
MKNNSKQGILLVNLGTPDAPTASAVKRFLSEFLHDRRVVDLTRWIWCPVLHWIILPRRSPKVAKLYQSIWMEDGSPLMVFSRSQAEKLQEKTGIPVTFGMSYGSPSIQDGISSLIHQGVTEIAVLPLYPQYSGTTTGSVFDRVSQSIRAVSVIPKLHFFSHYYDSPAYIQALASKVRESWKQHGKGDYLLCSYHGIPQRYADNGDVYPQHCQSTTRLLADALGLNEQQIGMSYQSRFGREEWLQPYTDETLKKLPGKGIRNIDIIAPAFSVDCLETLEEISEECRQIFEEAGGEVFTYIPCLNDDDEHIEMMCQVLGTEQV